MRESGDREREREKEREGENRGERERFWRERKNLLPFVKKHFTSRELSRTPNQKPTPLPLSPFK